MSDTLVGESTWNKARVEALSDGIFAIAMTLLVLEIKVPDLPRNVAPRELWHAVLEHGFVFFSFFVTFSLAGLFWFWHHISFHYIRRANGPILLINLVFLMFVSLLPFSTAMLGSFTLHQPVSLAMYFGNQLALGLALNAHWRYAKWRGLVVNPGNALLRRFGITLLMHPLACIVALGTLFVEPRQAFNAFVLVQAAGGLIIRRSRARWHPEELEQRL
jgi:uncharacterized membrane protein